MEKKNKLILFGIILITLIVLGVCIYSLITNKLEISDSTKFRNEYMELNDKVNKDVDKMYPNVILSETNTVKYISSKDLIKLLKEGTGVIYFGYNSCPWCRTLVPILTDVAERKNEIIYYYDISKIRSSYKIENDELVNTKKGTKDYYQILELLNDVLDDYILEDEAGNTYDTKEKRLYAPTVVALLNGKVTSMHVGTVSSQNSGYDKLTKDQVSELEKIVKELIESKNTECVQDMC